MTGTLKSNDATISADGVVTLADPVQGPCKAVVTLLVKERTPNAETLAAMDEPIEGPSTLQVRSGRKSRPRTLMRKIIFKKRFRKDVEKIRRTGRDMNRLAEVIDLLAEGEPLPSINRVPFVAICLFPDKVLGTHSPISSATSWR